MRSRRSYRGYDWPRYESAAERQAKARRNAAKLASKAGRKGEALEPVRSTVRGIASSFWGKSWCRHLESFSDYSNRLPRGRSYLSTGLVLDLKVSPGLVRALVSGSSLYTIEVEVAPLAADRWTRLKRACSGRIDTLVELLEGRLSEDVMRHVCERSEGLFPAPADIRLSCSCPDYATMCKHVAATLYGVGARLDARPELLFTLRGVDHLELIATGVSPIASAPAADRLEDTDLQELFGIDLAPVQAPPATAGDEELFADGEEVTLADLAAIGLARKTFQPWIRSRLLVPTGARGVYRATKALNPVILEALVRLG